MRVNSNLLVSISRKGRNVFVSFKDGSRYVYRDVSAETYAEWIAAESVGRYFLRVIRPQHQGEQIRASKVARAKA